MKLLTATFFAVILLALHAAVAQDPSMVPIPDNPSNPTPSTGPTPSPLFPTDNPPPPVERPHGNGGGNAHPDDARYLHGGDHPATQPQWKKKTTADDAQDVADRIKFREAKTKALHDEKIQAELANIDAAKTDPDKRAALKRYYTLLYAKILKIDGSLKKLVAERLKESLKRLDQSKVRPEDYPQEASAAQ